METDDRQSPSSVQLLRWGLAVYCIALVLRLLFIHQSHQEADFYQPTPGLDTSMHWEGAKHIRAGTPDPCFELMPPSAPFHPYFIAFCQTFLGENLLAHRIFRAIICSFSSMLICMITGRLAGRVWPGVAAGLTAATLNSWIYFDTMLIKAGIEILLLCLVLFLAIFLPANARRAGIYIGLGVAMGVLLSLMRFSQGNTTLFFIVIALFIALRTDIPGWQRKTMLILPMVLLAVGSQLAFKYRAELFGIPTTRFLPVSGVHVRIGFQHGAIGSYHVLKRFPALPLGHTYFARMAAEARAGRPLTPAEANQTYLDEAKTFIRENPGETVQILFRKLGLFVNHFEPAGNHYLAEVAERVPVLRLPHTGYGLLYVLSFWGAWSLLRQQRKAWLFLCVGLILSVLIVNLISFVTARYRIHATVPFLILSGLALPYLLEQWQQLRRHVLSTQRKVLKVGLFLLVTGVLAWSAYRTVLPNAREAMYQTARKNLALSRDSARFTAEAEAMAQIPERNAEQQFQLASLYHKLGRYTDCYKTLRVVAIQTPDFIPITRQYLVFLMWYGDYDYVVEYMNAVMNERPRTFQRLLQAFNSDSEFWMGADDNLRLIVQALLRDFIYPELDRNRLPRNPEPAQPRRAS